MQLALVFAFSICIGVYTNKFNVSKSPGAAKVLFDGLCQLEAGEKVKVQLLAVASPVIACFILQGIQVG
jgi:hypothetical protein